MSRELIDFMNDEIPKVSIIDPESISSRTSPPEQISYKNMVTREFSGNLDWNEVEEFDM